MAFVRFTHDYEIPDEDLDAFLKVYKNGSDKIWAKSLSVITETKITHTDMAVGHVCPAVSRGVCSVCTYLRDESPYYLREAQGHFSDAAKLTFTQLDD